MNIDVQVELYILCLHVCVRFCCKSEFSFSKAHSRYGSQLLCKSANRMTLFTVNAYSYTIPEAAKRRETYRQTYKKTMKRNNENRKKGNTKTEASLHQTNSVVLYTSQTPWIIDYREPTRTILLTVHRRRLQIFYTFHQSNKQIFAYQCERKERITLCGKCLLIILYSRPFDCCLNKKTQNSLSAETEFYNLLLPKKSAGKKNGRYACKSFTQVKYVDRVMLSNVTLLLHYVTM